MDISIIIPVYQAKDTIKNTINSILKQNLKYINPKIKNDVQNVIYEALLREKKFSGNYKSRNSLKSKKGVFNPLAIISHGAVTRLVCTREIDNITDNIIRHLPLHRFKANELWCCRLYLAR